LLVFFLCISRYFVSQCTVDLAMSAPPPPPVPPLIVTPTDTSSSSDLLPSLLTHLLHEISNECNRTDGWITSKEQKKQMQQEILEEHRKVKQYRNRENASNQADDAAAMHGIASSLYATPASGHPSV